MTEIKDVSEALRWLNLLVEEGERLLINTTLGPWSWVKNKVLIGKNNVDILEVPEKSIWGGDEEFMASSRSLVPAMVAGAKTVLETYTDLVATDANSPITGNLKYHIMSQEKLLIVLVQAYAPAMMELGWVPK